MKVKLSLRKRICIFIFICIGAVVLVSAAYNWIEELGILKARSEKQVDVVIAGAGYEGPSRVYEGK